VGIFFCDFYHIKNKEIKKVLLIKTPKNSSSAYA